MSKRSKKSKGKKKGLKQWMANRLKPGKKVKPFQHAREPNPEHSERKVFISPLVASKMAMWWFLAEGVIELNGFGLVEEKDGLLRWTDAFLFTGDGHSGGVTSSPDKMAAIIFTIVEAGQDPANLKLFWHFHTYNTFWSGMDTAAIETELAWTQGKEVFNAVLVGADILLRADRGLGNGKEAETLHTEWEVDENDREEWDFCRLQATRKFVSPYEIAGGHGYWGGASGQHAGLYPGSDRGWAAAYGYGRGRQAKAKCPFCDSTEGHAQYQGTGRGTLWFCYSCGAASDAASCGLERQSAEQVIGQYDGKFPPKQCPICDSAGGWVQHKAGGEISWYCYSCGAEVDRDGKVYGDLWGEDEQGCWSEYPGVGVLAIDPKTLVDEQGKYVGPWPPVRCPTCLSEDGEILGQDHSIWVCDKCCCTTGKSGTIYPPRYARPVLRPAAQARERRAEAKQ